MNAEVWLNGRSLGTHPYGYTSFWVDITDKVRFESANVRSVKVRNEGENSRWYSGSGIYRHVWLKTFAPVHVAQWGTYITTPEVNSASARVSINTHVLNESENSGATVLVTRLLDGRGTEGLI